jgi:oxygen-independent coproporphyrinogen-3 oxidase
MGKDLGFRGREASGPLSSLFLGGGTPSALAPGGLDRLCRGIRDNFRLAPGAEWSMEANPVSLTPEKLAIARDHGVGRISLGVQSFEPHLLRRMGRAHDRRGAEQALDLVAGSGLRWSADLIFALPGQTPAMFLDSLRTLLSWKPDHVSFYGLTVEPGTDFWKQARDGKLQEVPEDDYVRMYEEGVSLLEAEGIRRYEVSNFARPGQECRHNEAYWEAGAEWLAAGNSAHGFRGGVRVRNPRGLDAWSDWIDRGCPEEERAPERLAEEERWTEAWFLGLRTARGVDLERLGELFPDRQIPSQSLSRRLESGHVVREGSVVKLQGDGWLLLDAIAVELSG